MTLKDQNWFDDAGRVQLSAEDAVRLHGFKSAPCNDLGAVPKTGEVFSRSWRLKT